MVEDGETPVISVSRPWTSWVGLLAVLAWLACTAASSFTRGGGRPRREPGMPAPWKLIVWLVAVCAFFLMIGVAGAL